MRKKPEAVLQDIQSYLDETSELPWGTAHVILMEAQTMIESQSRQIVELETALTQSEYRSKQWEERFNSGRLT